MSVTKEQPYTPLVEKELREVNNALKDIPVGLRVRVISQLRTQEHYIQLQRAHVQAIHESLADKLRDIADSVDNLQDTLDNYENNND